MSIYGLSKLLSVLCVCVSLVFGFAKFESLGNAKASVPAADISIFHSTVLSKLQKVVISLPRSEDGDVSRCEGSPCNHIIRVGNALVVQIHTAAIDQPPCG